MAGIRLCHQILSESCIARRSCRATQTRTLMLCSELAFGILNGKSVRSRNGTSMRAIWKLSNCHKRPGLHPSCSESRGDARGRNLTTGHHLNEQQSFEKLSVLLADIIDCYPGCTVRGRHLEKRGRSLQCRVSLACYTRQLGTKYQRFPNTIRERACSAP